MEVLTLDLASLASVRQFSKTFHEKKLPLHYLINNAGVYGSDKPHTVDGFETHFGTNHLGPFLLTHLLFDVLKSSSPSRVVNTGAHGHKMGAPSPRFCAASFPN